MSDASPYVPRIALVCEGPTDHVVIEAALSAILEREFVLTRLQPEPTNPKAVNGWCGVHKWCEAFRQQGSPALAADPLLSLFDGVIIHVDADVVCKTYADCRAIGPHWPQSGTGALPCTSPGATVVHTAAALEAVLLSWLGLSNLGTKGVFCMPSQALESWLTAAIRPAGDPLLHNLESRTDLETKLANLPKKARLRKAVRDYATVAPAVTWHWAAVCGRCTQAAVFDLRFKSVAQAFPS